MAELTSTTLAVAASSLVTVLTVAMAYLAMRSFQKTRNPRLVFISVAFFVFAIKSLFVAFNVQSHYVQHDAIEFVSALFDVVIVVLFFIPFFVDLGR